MLFPRSWVSQVQRVWHEAGNHSTTSVKMLLYCNCHLPLQRDKSQLSKSDEIELPSTLSISEPQKLMASTLTGS